MEDTSPPHPGRKWLNKRDVVVALVGPVLILVLFLVYLVSPGVWVEGVDAGGDRSLVLFDAQGNLLPGAELGLFLRYVVEESHREYQLVEMITFGCSLLAGVLGLWATWIVLRRSLSLPAEGLGPLARFAAPVVLGMTSLAAVFFAGEEVNWGQTFTRWGVPEFMSADAEEAYAAQSLHNSMEGLSVQALGSGYLFVVLVVLPVLWRWRDAWRLPARWAPAVAAWPVVFLVIYTYIVKTCKDAYLLLFAGESPKLDPMYMGYYEQLNEQKEMLMAMSLLLYAGYALARARSGQSGGTAVNAAQADESHPGSGKSADQAGKS